jgi:hypothetical protein
VFVRAVSICQRPIRYRHSPTTTRHSIRSWQWMSPRVQGVTGMGSAQYIAPVFALLYLRVIDLITSLASCTSSAVVLVVQSPSYCSCEWCYAYSMSESMYSHTRLICGLLKSPASVEMFGSLLEPRAMTVTATTDGQFYCWLIAETMGPQTPGYPLSIPIRILRPKPQRSLMRPVHCQAMCDLQPKTEGTR